MYKLLAAISLLLTVTYLVSADEVIDIPGDELEGANVCKRVEEYTVDVVTSELEPYQRRVNTWCW